MTSVEEGNKIIADFIGVKTTASRNEQTPFKYHSNWDWLMPVLDKIGKNYHTSILDKVCTISNADYVVQKRSITRIEAVWLAVIDFIQWYNKQQNK